MPGVVASDPSVDLALLEIPANGHKAAVISDGDARAPEKWSSPSGIPGASAMC